jgi:hypothetical protein
MQRLGGMLDFFNIRYNQVPIEQDAHSDFYSLLHPILNKEKLNSLLTPKNFTIAVDEAKINIFTKINQAIVNNTDILANKREKLKSKETITIPPGHIALLDGTCFHGGCKNKPPTILFNKNGPIRYGYIRLHGYLTLSSSHILEGTELVQGWYNSFEDVYK